MDNEKYMKRCYELAIQAGKKGYDSVPLYTGNESLMAA